MSRDRSLKNFGACQDEFSLIDSSIWKQILWPWLLAFGCREPSARVIQAFLDCMLVLGFSLLAWCKNAVSPIDRYE